MERKVNGYTLYRKAWVFSNIWLVTADEMIMGTFSTEWGAKRYANKLPYYKDKHELAVEENQQNIIDELLKADQEFHDDMIGHYIEITPSLFDRDTIITILPEYEEVPIIEIKDTADIVPTRIQCKSNNKMYYCKLFVMEDNYEFLKDNCKKIFNHVSMIIHDKYLRQRRISNVLQE